MCIGICESVFAKAGLRSIFPSTLFIDNGMLIFDIQTSLHACKLLGILFHTDCSHRTHLSKWGYEYTPILLPSACRFACCSPPSRQCSPLGAQLVDRSLTPPPHPCCYTCVCGLAQCSYIIYRDEVEIATVGAGTLQFTNTSRTQGWAYTYRFGLILLCCSALISDGRAHTLTHCAECF